MAVARPGDADSPEALVAAVYDVISGPAHVPRDWERFRTLFEDGARFLLYMEDAPVGGPGRGEWDVERFVADATLEYAKDGFWEREIWSRVERFGNIAHVFSTYESRAGGPDTEPIGRGINSVQCVRHDGRWWIAHLVFDFERPGKPLPQRYRPK